MSMVEDEIIINGIEQESLQEKEGQKSDLTDLQDDLWRVTIQMEKTCFMLQELTDEYFRKYNRSDKEDHFAITFEFKRNAILADIADEYANQVRKALEKIEARVEKARAAQN